MRINVRVVSEWPKLAWVASMDERSREINVVCGPMVEAGDGWIAEAVWAGDYLSGDFDRTDLVFGTGIRCRNDHVVFVSSGTTLDRLVYCKRRKQLFVSNSLPALLATARDELVSDYLGYARDFHSVKDGLSRCVKSIPAESGNIEILHFHNLLYNGHELLVCNKPTKNTRLNDFTSYRTFLFDAANQLGRNATNDSRRHSIHLLATVSSGYDSPAAAVIAKQAGCRQTVTIDRCNSLWRGSDSGEAIAHNLGLSCQVYPRALCGQTDEAKLWVSTGRPTESNLATFKYPQPLCLLFTGYHGDKIWDLRPHDVSEDIVRGDSSGAGIGELRLHRGVFHCAVPFWACRSANQIDAIGRSEEMASWTLHGSYDRPIPRRLVEEEGVPRRLFGVRKKMTVTEGGVHWPFSRQARRSIESFYRRQNVSVPPKWMLLLIDQVVRADTLFYKNVTKRFGIKKGVRPWHRLTAESMVLHWACSEVRQQYAEGLEMLEGAATTD